MKKRCGPDNFHRLRKFIAKPSAGLRVRIHPTLQSEQIGVLPVDGVVSIVDELQNSDGVWVRLAPETMVAMAINHAEGWCLQYNNHLEKTLLVPVEEHKDKTDDIALYGARARQQPQQDNPSANSNGPNAVAGGLSSIFPNSEPILRNSRLNRKRSSVTRGPGLYTVVKCGASGHNIRSNPNLLAAPIGMLSLGDVVNILEVRELVPSGEVWAKLDQDAMEKHGFSHDGGDAWSLAVSATDVQYLQSEAETEENKIMMLEMSAGSGLNDNPLPPQRHMQMTSPLVAPRSRPRYSEPSGPSMVGPLGAAEALDGAMRRKSDFGGSRNSPIHFDFSGK